MCKSIKVFDYELARRYTEGKMGRDEYIEAIGDMARSRRVTQRSGAVSLPDNGGASDGLKPKRKRG